MRLKPSTPYYVQFYIGAVMLGLMTLLTSNRYGQSDIFILLCCISTIGGTVSFYVERWLNKRK